VAVLHEGQRIIELYEAYKPVKADEGVTFGKLRRAAKAASA
jgi:hypothetical protein